MRGGHARAQRGRAEAPPRSRVNARGSSAATPKGGQDRLYGEPKRFPLLRGREAVSRFVHAPSTGRLWCSGPVEVFLPAWAMKDQGVSPLPSSPELEEATTRTTVRPPFDPEQFARETDSRVGDTDPPSERPTAPPPPGLPQYAPGATSGTMPVLASLDVDVVPALVIAREDLEWFELPKAARDLLGEVDGHTTLGTLCARAGFPLDAALSLCHELDRQGLVTLRRGSNTSG